MCPETLHTARRRGCELLFQRFAGFLAYCVSVKEASRRHDGFRHHKHDRELTMNRDLRLAAFALIGLVAAGCSTASTTLVRADKSSSSGQVIYRISEEKAFTIALDAYARLLPKQSVDDIVDGILKCATSPSALGRSYNLASGIETTVGEVASLVNALVRNSGGVSKLPRRDWDHISKRRASIERASSELGYQPKIPIKEGVERTIKWMRANLARIDRDSKGINTDPSRSLLS